MFLALAWAGLRYTTPDDWAFRRKGDDGRYAGAAVNVSHHLDPPALALAARVVGGDNGVGRTEVDVMIS